MILSYQKRSRVLPLLAVKSSAAGSRPKFHIKGRTWEARPLDPVIHLLVFSGKDDQDRMGTAILSLLIKGRDWKIVSTTNKMYDLLFGCRLEGLYVDFVLANQQAQGTPVFASGFCCPRDVTVGSL